MRQITISLIALFLIGISIGQAAAQEPAQKPAAPSSASDKQQPKSEVEKELEESKNRGETVLSVCLENCGDSKREDAGVEPGRALVLPKPVYPPIAASAHATGEVEVRVLIDHDGKVIAASAISGHPLLQATSVRAARDAVFTPSKVDGKPVKVVGVIVYYFVQ